MANNAVKSVRSGNPRQQWSDLLSQMFPPTFGPGIGRLAIPRIGAPGGWFLGPYAENKFLLLKLIEKAILQHCEHRTKYADHYGDPEMIDIEVRRSDKYRKAVDTLDREASKLSELLSLSAPIASMRSHGHMLWDQVLPAMVGYFAGMLYNQNNVAPEASPVTTQLEIRVCEELCAMLGYSVQSPQTPTDPPQSWGHITCDGSVANIEALWAARNVKFYPVALRAAIRHALDPRVLGLLKDAKDVEAHLPDGTKAKLLDLDRWALVNLTIDEVLDLPRRIHELTDGRITKELLSEELEPFVVPQIGLADFYHRYLLGDRPRTGWEPVLPPCVMVPATAHYSWPKGGTLLGIGKRQIVPIEIDDQFRMKLDHLEYKLEERRKNRRPVLAVVAVLGTTEEGAVDPLKEVLALRDRFRRAHNFDFAIHCDATWGGYFQCMRAPPSLALAPTPEYPMNDYVDEQYRVLHEADSITVDPHKSGYAPYPVGAICYRNFKLRDMVSLVAPVVLQDPNQPSVGVYGIEGSKPGAAAASVFLAHRVIPLDRTGYGKILGQCVFTSKRMYCRLRTMNDRDPASIKGRYKIVMLQPLPAERDFNSWGSPQDQLKTIREFVALNNNQLLEELRLSNTKTKLFNELGSDQLILAFAFNFREKGAADWNKDPIRFNDFNKEIFKRCSVVEPPNPPDITKLPPLILTGSQFDPKATGPDLISKLAALIGLQSNANQPLRFLISTTMNPWTTVVPDSPRTPNGDFLQVIEDTLRNEVIEAGKALGYNLSGP